MYRDYIQKNIADPCLKDKANYDSIMKGRDFTNIHVAEPGSPEINIHIPEVKALYYEKYRDKKDGTRNLQATEQPTNERELAIDNKKELTNKIEFDIRRRPDFVSLDSIDFIPRYKGAMDH